MRKQGGGEKENEGEGDVDCDSAAYLGKPCLPWTKVTAQINAAAKRGAPNVDVQAIGGGRTY